MKEKPIRGVVFLCAIMCLCFCNEQVNNKLGSTEVKHEIKDTIIKDIPIDKAKLSYRTLKRNIENKLGLNALENGFNDVQIRLWYGYALKDKEQLVIFKKINSLWSAELYTFTYLFNDKYDSVLSISKEVIERSPKSGWQDFTKKLIDLGILTLPDYHALPDYYIGSDPDGVTIEIATINKYRIYSYPEPSYHKEKSSQANNIVEIMELIENEFDFKRLRKF